MKLPPISSICSILLGGTVALVSTASFTIDLINTRNPFALAIDIAVMTVSYLTVWQGIKYTSFDQIAHKNANTVFDTRVEPLIKLLTETAGKVDAMQEDILRTDRKVDSTLDYVIKSQNTDMSKAMVFPGVSFRFNAIIQTLIMISFGILVLISSYPLGTVHYVITAVYLGWWLLISSEYKILQHPNGSISIVGWIYGIAPVLIIPSTAIIMTAIYGVNIMIWVLYLCLVVYAYSYFAWASYMTMGYKLIDIKPVLYMIRNRLKREKKEADTKYVKELQEMVK